MLTYYSFQRKSKKEEYKLQVFEFEPKKDEGSERLGYHISGNFIIYTGHQVLLTDQLTLWITVLRAADSCLASQIPHLLWKPKFSLPCSQEPATGPYAEPDESSHIITPCFFKTHFNTIIPSIPSSLKWSVTLTIILPVVLYGCETWSLTLRVSGNRVLKTVNLRGRK
jgi:hypothetical protein